MPFTTTFILDFSMPILYYILFIKQKNELAFLSAFDRKKADIKINAFHP